MPFENLLERLLKHNHSTFVHVTNKYFYDGTKQYYTTSRNHS